MLRRWRRLRRRWLVVMSPMAYFSASIHRQAEPSWFSRRPARDEPPGAPRRERRVSAAKNTAAGSSPKWAPRAHQTNVSLGAPQTWRPPTASEIWPQPNRSGGPDLAASAGRKVAAGGVVVVVGAAAAAARQAHCSVAFKIQSAGLGALEPAPPVHWPPFIFGT